jgi:hypothetical protein
MVAREAIQVTPQQMANAQISHTAMVSPQRESVFAGGRTGAGVAQPSQSMMRQQVVAKTTPPPAPVSFQARQAALNQNGGRPLAPAQVTQLRQQQPAAVLNRAPVRSAATSGTQGRTFQNTNGFGSGRPAVTAPQQTMPQQTAPQPQRPMNRLDSRPPTTTQPGAQPTGQTTRQPTGQTGRPEVNRPDVNRPQPSQQPSQPQYRRPAPEATPESRPAAPQSAAPARPAPQGRPPSDGRGRRPEQDKDKKEERR